MKVLILVSFVLAFTLAEPPLSNSYLPPSPNAPPGGYPSGGPAGPVLPEVVAARTFGGIGQAAVGTGFPRNGFRSGAAAQARFSPNGEQGYDRNAAFIKNSLDEGTSEPANYNFGYNVNDYQEGTDFGHQETRKAAKAQGKFHVVLPDGRKQTVSYEADERGYKPRISYEDTEATVRAGYDANVSNGVGYHGNGNHGGGYHSNANHGARIGNGRSGYN